MYNKRSNIELFHDLGHKASPVPPMIERPRERPKFQSLMFGSLLTTERTDYPLSNLHHLIAHRKRQGRIAPVLDDRQLRNYLKTYEEYYPRDYSFVLAPLGSPAELAERAQHVRDTNQPNGDLEGTHLSSKKLADLYRRLLNDPQKDMVVGDQRYGLFYNVSPANKRLAKRQAYVDMLAFHRTLETSG